MTGESGSQSVEIPAVAGQPMDADNNAVLTRVSPFAVCNTMKTMGIECKKAMLVRLRCHVRLKTLRNEHTPAPEICCLELSPLDFVDRLDQVRLIGGAPHMTDNYSVT